MHTVALLEHALEAAEQLGYGIRQEPLGGGGGGVCEFGGNKWIFVDLELNADERLEQVAEALRADQRVFSMNLAPPLASYLGVRKSA